MARYIDSDQLYNAVEQRYRMSSGIEHRCERDLLDLICEQPALSPDDVRGVGEWEDAKQHGLCRCSVCKDCYIEKDYITQAKWRYCPNCGARLEVSEDA